MNICERCNGCGWENPAQAIDKCSACGGSGMTERERLTVEHLRNRTFQMMFDAVKNREDINKLEMSITREEFNDLRLDVQFINLFDWAMMKSIPTEFKCNNVTVRIK